MRVGTAVAAGVVLIAVAFALTLSHAPLVVARDNMGITHKTLAATTTPAGACQGDEVMPSGTSAIRLGLTTVVGPAVTVQVWSGSRLLASGHYGTGWEGASVTVPVTPVARDSASVRVCFHLSDLNGPVGILGLRGDRHAATTEAGKPLPGRLRIAYLRPGRASWWSMALATARRLGLGRAASGTWNALLVMALAGTLIAVSSWLMIRELR